MSLQALQHLRQRLKRRRKRIAFVVGAALLMTAAIWGVLVEGTLLRHLVAAAIGSRLNATCAIDHFHWNGWNRAEIRGLSLRVKDWPEIASEVISIGSMSADFDPLPLLWGSLALTDISIDRMTIRVIERRGDRELNILDLRLPDTRGSTVRPPRINISDLALHVGELDERKGELRFEGRHDLVGSVTSDEQVRGQWKLVLTQKGAGDSPPATLEGTLSGADFDYSVTLRNLELDESIERLMPRGVLPMWEELGIRGRIDAVTLAGSRDQQVREARIRVSDISVTLPKTIGMEEIWARYRHGAIEPDVGGPRILVRSGEMEFRDWMLVLRELRGELTSSDESQQVVPLPMSLSFWIDLYRGRTQIWSAASAREWAETAFEHAPFGLHLQVENYTMREVDGEAPTLELPRLAAEILHNFQVRQGRVSIDAYVTRDEPFWRGEEPRESPPLEGPIASEIQVRGSLLINEGEGAYFKFPYLLTDVQAHITFENDLVEVERLRGKGSGGSEILVSGTVIDPGDDAGVDLRIMTASAPIDEALEGALVDSPAQRFLKLLFCRPAFESLLEAGLPGSEVSRMRERRERLLRSLAETDSTRAPDPDRVKSLTEGPWPRPEPQKRRAGDPAAAEAIRRFASIDWLSRFRPGGRCALDLRVRRDVGGGDLVETTGRIVLIESDALCEPLPYPIHVLGRDIVGAAAATITVEDERIVLPDGGLRIQLPGGGSGSIQGWIDLPRTSGNDRIVIPHLTVRNSGDAINDLLLAAIPVDNPSGPILGPSNGWPGTRRSETATLLERIGLEGVLDTVIEIGGDGKGAITWRLDLELSDGTAKPRESLGADVAESGLEWPQGFDLDRCRAKVLVDERTARLSEFEGHADDGIVRARGSVDLVSLDRELSVDFENIGAHEYLVNLLPHSDRETGRSFWHRHEPAGAFDASLRWDHDEDGATRRELVVRPRWFSFTADPPGAEPPFERRRVEVRHRAGDVAILGSTITARGFEIDVDEAGLPVSRLSIDGVLAAPERNARGALRAAWTGADLSSSALLEGLSLADADEAVELWSSLRPSGRFDAELGLDPAGPGLERVPRATARLRRVDATVDGVATSLEVEPSSSPVEIRPPLVRFADFRARTPNGRLECRGSIPIELEGAPSEPLVISYDGERVGEPEIALMGAGTRRAIEAIELVCDGPVRMRNGEVAFEPIDGALVPGFRGEVSVSNASFRSGAAFKELHARVSLDVPPSGGADIRIDSPSFRVLDRTVHDASARVVVTPGATRVTVDPLTGTLAGGSASAQAVVNISPQSAGGGDYRVSASLVGAQLSDIPSQPTEEGAEVIAGKRVDGRVDAAVLIGGPLDQPARRTGRGQVEIRDGRMAELPITLSLIQVSQLMLPLNTALDSGDIRFHVDGERLTFERFDLTCPTLQFLGRGDFDLKHDALALRFRTRGTVPIWSDLFAALSETLYAIDVTGTVNKPNVSLVPLPPFAPPPSMQLGRERNE